MPVWESPEYGQLLSLSYRTLPKTQLQLPILQTGSHSHYGSDGSHPSQRIQAAGYQGTFIAENLAGSSGVMPIDRAVNGWLVNPGHCVNLMDPRAQETDLANATRVWTQVLAKPF
jgi:uncharacterized protein YkwD